MKECFVITTYCNTPDRVEELKRCIRNLQQFDADILIHAHYPLDLDVQKLGTYYIYDSTNPVIRDGSKSIIRWKWYKTANKLLTIPNPDYSYAVMNQWVSSLKFLKDKGYDKMHVINYDTFINNFIFRKHQTYLQNHDVVFEYTGLNPKDYNADTVSDKSLIFIVFFSIKSNFINVLTNELTLEKYLQSKDTMMETYIMEVLDKIENRQKELQGFGLEGIYKIKKLYDTEFKLYLGDAVLDPLKKEECDVYTTISEANGFDLIKKTYLDEFKNEKDWCFIFGGHNTQFNKFEILIFEITKQIDEIIICINDDITKVSNVTDNYYSLITKYSIDEIVKIIDDGKLLISINGEKVDKNVINVMKHQGIQLKNN